MFYKHTADINLKGATMLILNDLPDSVGVIISAIIIKFTGLYFVDPLNGVLIGLLVAYPTYFFDQRKPSYTNGKQPCQNRPGGCQKIYLHEFRGHQRHQGLTHMGLSPEKIMMAVRIRTKGYSLSQRRNQNDEASPSRRVRIF